MDAQPDSEAREVPPRNKWANLQLALGHLQVIGSAAAFFLLLSQGLTNTLIWVFNGTMALTITSIVLFRILRVQDHDR